MTSPIRTTVICLQPFELSGFNETLPAGEYDIETELLDPVDWIEPGDWTASVLVHLHPRASHPGLARTLSVPLAVLQRAIAKDKVTGKPLTNFFLEEMLADPMIRLVMQADGVTDGDVRESLRARHTNLSLRDGATPTPAPSADTEDTSGRGPVPGSLRPGIGK